MQNRFLPTKAARYALAIFVMAVGFSENASAVLIDAGADFVYDTVLDITWTRHAGDGIERDWAGANAWAADLAVDGVSGWRLPYASVSEGAGPIATLPIGQPCTGSGGADEVVCRDNEMAYMFYYNLGGTFGSPKGGTQTAVGGQVLTGIQNVYWSGTAFAAPRAWIFHFRSMTVENNGRQATNGFFPFPIDSDAAWAVHVGHVTAVPEPATASLLLLALVVLVGSGLTVRRE